jgi:ABC-type xylose transport system permease subunit
VVVLLVVWLIFDWRTGNVFLSSRNLSNLSVQFSITAMLAVGAVMVMIAAEIDLSAGSTVGLCAIFAADLLTNYGFPLVVAIIITLALGLLIGIWHGLWVAVGGVPSFITTLASLLGLGGVALVITSGRTFVTPNSLSFVANSYLPLWFLLLAAAGVVLGVLLLAERERRVRIAVGLGAPRLRFVALPVVVASAGVGACAYVFASYRGLPVPILILGVVGFSVAFVLKHTVLGRHIYAIGGNREATRRAGIDVTRLRIWPFVVMGLLYGVAGLIFASRLGGAPAQGMVGEELNVIAAAVLGGTSLFGGVGSVGGAILGALLMESLSNGMVLMNVVSYYQEIVVGGMLLIAVYFDVHLRAGTND